ALFVLPLECFANRAQLANSDGARQLTDQRRRAARAKRPRCAQVDGRELATAFDLDRKTPATCRHETVAPEPGLDARAHPPDDGQEAALDEVKGRRPRVVRASLEHDTGIAFRKEQR